jgi:hypothetical protein
MLCEMNCSGKGTIYFTSTGAVIMGPDSNSPVPVTLSIGNLIP